MTPLSRPMKAVPLLHPNVEHSDQNILAAMQLLRYPVWATTKWDGIRAIRTSDLFSQRLKLIPNVEIRRRSMKFPSGIDMELCNPELEYHEVESIVMSQKHERHYDVHFQILDWYHKDYPLATYCERMIDIQEQIPLAEWQDCRFEPPRLCVDAAMLMEFFLKTEKEKQEGICFRLGNSPYKQGKSTMIEQYLVKLARYIRTECVIIGFEEQMYNSNTTQRNSLGYMDRSKAKENLLGKDTLGKLVCLLPDGREIKVGTGVGLTDRLRKEIWNNQQSYLRKVITIKHKPFGQKDLPRHPVMVGFRKD